MILGDMPAMGNLYCYFPFLRNKARWDRQTDRQGQYVMWPQNICLQCLLQYFNVIHNRTCHLYFHNNFNNCRYFKNNFCSNLLDRCYCV